jgi:hypothetical protein
MASIPTQSAKKTNSQLAVRLFAAWIVVLLSLLLTAPGVVAQTNVDFFCALGGSSTCTGTVTQSGVNFSSTGISVFNDSGPFNAAVPFMLAFNTATNTISIDGTGIYSGVNLIGNILSFSISGTGTTKDFSLVAGWPTLPAVVQTQLGSPTGQDSGFVIYLTGTGAAQSVDVIITPTPEPASMFLVGTGLLAIGGLLRRKRRSASV